ncbi:MAG: hypothetical protein JW963_23205 [Anaerolineales bacterium]|nr:hypothetical protein [Anaerolineales bacterium]
MNLIDRYVTEVGKHLPRKNRLDIEKELRSTLEDMLEDRSQQTGHPADEALATELLQEYGAPRKVAASYQTHPYLIGPRMFPTYMLVLKIVFFAVTLGLTIATLVSLIGSNMTSPELLQKLVDFGAGLVSALVAAFGNVTLVFAILERTVPASEFGLQEEQEWDPASLLKEPDIDQVKPAELIFEIIFIAAALVIFNFYPQIIGFNFTVDGQWVSVPVLSEAFFRVLPWITLVGGLEISLSLYLLQKQAWGVGTRIAKIVLEAANIAIAVMLLRGPSLLKLDAGAFAGSPIGIETAETLVRVFTPMVPLILLIVIVVSGIEIAKMAFRLTKVNYKTG